MRPRPRPSAALLLLAAVLLVTGCGGDDTSTPTERRADTGSTPRAAEEAGDASGGDGAAAAQATATLEVSIANVGGKDPAGAPLPAIACSRSIPATCSTELECPTAEQASPREVAACTWLATAEAGETLREPEAERACTMVYGGPEVATITGTLDGDDVDSEIGRQNGCEIARWDAAQVLWTDPGARAEPAPEVVTPG